MVQAPTALHENDRMGWEDLPGTAHKHVAHASDFFLWNFQTVGLYIYLP